MGKAVTPPALDKRTHKEKCLNWPKLSFNAAMRYFFAEQGEIYNVFRSPTAIFTAFVQTSLQAEKDLSCQVICLQDLAGLDYADPERLDRWYALLTLLENKIPVQLFLTREEAVQALNNTTTTRK